MQNPSATPLPQILTYIWNSPANEMQLNIIEVPGHMAKNRYWPISSMTSLFSYLIKYLFRKGMGVYKSCPRRSNGWKGSCCVNYLPWISPLNTWLFPARVASHSTDDRRISEREITTCFISGRKMGSSSTQCFASMAIYAQNTTEDQVQWVIAIQNVVSCPLRCHFKIYGIGYFLHTNNTTLREIMEKNSTFP